MTFPTLGPALESLRLNTARKREARRAAVREAGRLPIPERVTDGPFLKVWPALAQRCLLKRRDRELRLWTLARSLPGAGSGRVRVAELAGLIEREEIGGLSPGTLRRLLKSGSGTFWTIALDANGDKVLYLAGLGSVCLALGVERLSSAPVLLPGRWARSLRSFRAACYASGFPTSKLSNPISRSVIEGLTGRTPRTQRGYDQALGGLLDKRDNAKLVNGKPKNGDELPPGHFVDRVRTRDGNEHLVICQRLPNSFEVGFERAARGMTRRVNRLIRTPVRHEGTGNQREKLFYRDPKAAGRRIQQQRESDWFCIAGAEVAGRHVKETIGKTQLWTGVQKVGGEVFFC